MPRALNEKERAAVMDRLLTVSRDRFIRQGLVKTTIEQLAADAQIGKGTFYQFFSSKEELFFAISQNEELAFREALKVELQAHSSGAGAVQALLLSPETRLRSHPFLRLLLEPETIEALTKRLGLERLQRANSVDRDFFFDLARSWRARGWLPRSVTNEEVFHSLSGLFLIALQQGLIGSEATRIATSTIVDALVSKWTHGVA
jgi:AcrR family transcriptional regulator